MSELEPIDDGPVRAGEAWRFRGGPGQDGAVLTVLRVERFGDRVFVHVRLDGVRIVHAGGIATWVAHLPFDEAAIRESVTSRVDEGIDTSGLLEGYAAWREAFDAGQAGAFSIPVAEAIGVVERMLNP
jgi:hypothetical protein